MNGTMRVFKVALATNDVDAFLQACEASEWHAMDTGERIMTEEGPDAEAVILVAPSASEGIRAPAALVH